MRESRIGSIVTVCLVFVIALLGAGTHGRAEAAAAASQTCIDVISNDDGHRFGTLFVEATGVGGRFVSLAGAALNWGVPNAFSPLVDSAFFRSDGQFHFAFFIGTGTPEMLAEGSLFNPTYSTGAGIVRNTITGVNTSVTFNTVTCPVPSE